MNSDVFEPEPDAPGMITVRTRVAVDDHGVATLRLPPDIAPGLHEAVIVIEETLAQDKTPTLDKDKRSIREWMPRHDVAVDLLEGFSIRREELYDDSGRGA